MRPFLDGQGFAYEVILASDGDDPTPEIAAEISRSWSNLVISAERGRHGKGHGIRRDAALARGEIVCFLDADYKTPIDELSKLSPWLGNVATLARQRLRCARSCSAGWPRMPAGGPVDAADGAQARQVNALTARCTATA
jgi:cellulose synthase/poly-beta-1,6-N-acetylglucosamine synthase-like glycosyltransferase